MKLFQRLLVAPAALSLMAPIAANADTAFSSSTTLSGGAYFTTGSVSAGTGDEDEEMYMQYAYAIDFNSSFTGEDLLYVGVETGNASGPLENMDSATGGGGTIGLHSIYYSFPVGDVSVTTGPLLDQDDVVAVTTSAYSDAFRLGSMPYSLAGSETGPGVGVSYSTGSGIVASASFVAADGQLSDAGINTDTGNDVTTLTVGYDGDGFGGGLVIASNDGDVADDDGNATGYDTFGGGIYYSPDSVPATISLAYDTIDPEDGDEATDLFVGVDYEVGPGTLSAAWHTTEVDDDNDDTDVSGYEVSYTFPINDNVSVTPGIFSVEDGNSEDDSGVVVETAFSF